MSIICGTQEFMDYTGYLFFPPIYSIIHLYKVSAASSFVVTLWQIKVTYSQKKKIPGSSED